MSSHISQHMENNNDNKNELRKKRTENLLFIETFVDLLSFIYSLIVRCIDTMNRFPTLNEEKSFRRIMCMRGSLFHEKYFLNSFCELPFLLRKRRKIFFGRFYCLGNHLISNKHLTIACFELHTDAASQNTSERNLMKLYCVELFISIFRLLFRLKNHSENTLSRFTHTQRSSFLCELSSHQNCQHFPVYAFFIGFARNEMKFFRYFFEHLT